MTDNNNNILILDLPTEENSVQFARQLALNLTPPLVMAFSGEIGTGKTTIIRALLKHLGVSTTIKSPTFSLVETYVIKDTTIHHFDLYRILHEDELEYIGFRDYFNQQSICCIEWAEHAGKMLSGVDIRFKLGIKGSGREMHIIALSEAGRRILACLR